ncbi:MULTISPECIES: polysaccharide deacetylase family protein [Paenibacillus]|uniref:Polysaccharide deacetylase n=1 Tax=Paenibacillus naphthalenovorans TaxID=162209 RepID=A0A0U2VLQ6_9BACL|nr:MULTISPECIES: polysaccharide deacetylase family protein [Paenibacillus]ALS21686.1 polysaccharide deacetylase [Paenibacillus naphthalenovorans]GCL71415.1 hypothetical protein PN4B1_13200 [Paenibacillus naphthalenovorans]SDI88680.1 probable sporulation protein, polysaccharide deacetylase family [Paenibacillus naphthalenovorans]
MKRYQLLFTAACFGAVLVLVQQSPQVERFVQHAIQSSASTNLIGSPLGQLARQVWREDPDTRKAKLLEHIQAEAKRLNVAPINAKVDRVWKAIPGYNGLEIDVEKTLELAERESFPDPPKLLFREVPPQVGLEQLGPHPVYKGNPNKPMAAFMINVAWGEEYLPVILETLKKENVRATFFFDGSWLRKNIPMARTIMEQGHEMSNHAYSHKDMSKLSRAQAFAEISKTEELLKRELGVDNKLFAPPSGDFNQTTVEIAHSMKLRTILWTLDTVDWKNPEPSSIVRKIETRIEPGSLILMHPTSSSSKALPGMIRVIKSKGLQLGTVSEVISPQRVPKVESAEY